MVSMRKTCVAAFKAKVALEAVKRETTITEIASEFSVHPNQIRQKQAPVLERLPEMFSQRESQTKKSQDELVTEVFRQIGQLKVELDWSKSGASSLELAAFFW